MLIMTQSGDKIVNLDNMNTVRVEERDGKYVLTATMKGISDVVLGKYNAFETAIKALEEIYTGQTIYNLSGMALLEEKNDGTY